MRASSRTERSQLMSTMSALALSKHGSVHHLRLLHRRRILLHAIEHGGVSADKMAIFRATLGEQLAGEEELQRLKRCMTRPLDVLEGPGFDMMARPTGMQLRSFDTHLAMNDELVRGHGVPSVFLTPLGYDE
jgi:hypothetical protein